MMVGADVLFTCNYTICFSFFHFAFLSPPVIASSLCSHKQLQVRVQVQVQVAGCVITWRRHWPMMSSQYLARSASGSSVERSDRNASSHVSIPNSRVITNIANSFLPYTSLVSSQHGCFKTSNVRRILTSQQVELISRCQTQNIQFLLNE